MLTLLALKAICPKTKTAVLEPFVEPLNDAMEEWGINTPQRQAAFLAQVAHESGAFRYTRELASGSAYEDRTDLGNTPEDDGDGPRYRGRGIMQITGTDNMRDCSTAIFGDPDLLLYHPELLERPDNACRAAGWFWKKNGLNELADAENFRKITLRINGGLNGWDDRLVYWGRAKEAIA